MTDKPAINEKLIGILIELGNIGIKGSLKPNEYYLNKCQQAHDQIIELWKECLPKIAPEQLHAWYLLAIAWIKRDMGGQPFSHNPEAIKEYKDLAPEQRHIDKYIANKINQAITQAEKNMEAL